MSTERNERKTLVITAKVALKDDDDDEPIMKAKGAARSQSKRSGKRTKAENRFRKKKLENRAV